MSLLRKFNTSWSVFRKAGPAGLWDLFKERALGAALMRLSPMKYKRHSELKYWKKAKALEGFSNEYYRQYFTAQFGLKPDYYTGKSVLDIGCGPQGTLEWADMVSERIGLDPLAAQYLLLGGSRNKMKYVAAPAEKMPFADEYFDIVTSFNSLDHVDDICASIAEIKRVVKPGGLCLLLVDVDHEPTPCEPHVISWNIVDAFQPEFELLQKQEYEQRGNGVFAAIQQDRPYDHTNRTKRGGVLSAKFRKRAINKPNQNASVVLPVSV